MTAAAISYVHYTLQKETINNLQNLEKNRIAKFYAQQKIRKKNKDIFSKREQELLGEIAFDENDRVRFEKELKVAMERS